MKKMIASAVLVLLISTVSFAKKVVAEGKTYSAFGDYKIETADNTFLMKGEDCKAFKISYENTPMEVTVVVCNDKNCRKYIVLSEKLSVQYVCNRSYFGVEKLDKSHQVQGKRTTYENLNSSEFSQQKILGPGQQSMYEATRLIAAYFPFLINPVENMVAEK